MNSIFYYYYFFVFLYYIYFFLLSCFLFSLCTEITGLHTGSTVEPGYSEVHKSDRSFHYSYYFTIARAKYMCVVETVRPVASV